VVFMVQADGELDRPPGAVDEMAALRAALDACLAGAGHHSRILVARAAEALDDLRDQLAYADSLVAEQQARIIGLYDLFTGREGDGHGGRLG
jgi:hypothetical protein